MSIAQRPYEETSYTGRINLDPDDLSENRKQIAASSQVLSCRSHGRRHKLIMLLSKFLKDQSGATDCDEKSSRLAPGERSLFEAIGNASSSTIPARDVAIVVAHPDDESIGCGAQLARLQGRTVFVVTDGAPLDPCFAGWHGFPSIEAYAQARQREIRTALKLADMPECDLVLMKVPDQEAAWRLEEITWSLIRAFAMRGTRSVLTHSYEGGHPDHDATAFAVHAAAQILARCGRRIDIIEMPFYRMGTTRRVFQSFTEDRGNRQLGLLLTGDRLALKRKMLESHASQQPTISMFSAHIEQFRRAPRYDFTKLPNGGNLFYETRRWGMTGARWVELAGRANHQLRALAAA